jgi:DNA-binding NarL/FixJ family response regulator
MSDSVSQFLHSVWNWKVLAGRRRRRARVLVSAADSATLALVDRLLGPEFKATEHVSDGFALVRVALELSPDLIVADFDTPGLDGIEATARLSLSKNRTPVVILARQIAHELIEEAFEAGASAYVLQSDATEELLEAVRTAMQGRHFVSHSCR